MYIYIYSLPARQRSRTWLSEQGGRPQTSPSKIPRGAAEWKDEEAAPEPLSSKPKIHMTIKARSWPWIEPSFGKQLFETFTLLPPRSAVRARLKRPRHRMKVKAQNSTSNSDDFFKIAEVFPPRSDFT